MFKPTKSVSGQDIKKGLIDNSANLAVGEVIIPGISTDTSVVLTGGGTVGALLGVVLGIEGKGGKVLEKSSITVASDNETVDMVQVAYLPLYIPMEFTSDLDAAAETTDNSGAHGNFSVDATGLLVDESTVAVFSTVENMQLFSFGLTGKDTTQVSLVFISKMLGYNIA